VSRHTTGRHYHQHVPMQGMCRNTCEVTRVNKHTLSHRNQSRVEGFGWFWCHSGGDVGDAPGDALPHHLVQRLRVCPRQHGELHEPARFVAQPSCQSCSPGWRNWQRRGGSGRRGISSRRSTSSRLAADCSLVGCRCYHRFCASSQ